MFLLKEEIFAESFSREDHLKTCWQFEKSLFVNDPPFKHNETDQMTTHSLKVLLIIWFALIFPLINFFKPHWINFAEFVPQWLSWHSLADSEWISGPFWNTSSTHLDSMKQRNSRSWISIESGKKRQKSSRKQHCFCKKWKKPKKQKNQGKKHRSFSRKTSSLLRKTKYNDWFP